VGRRVRDKTGGRQNPALQLDGFYDHYALVRANGDPGGNTAAKLAQTPPVQSPDARPSGDQLAALPPVNPPIRRPASGFLFPDSHQRLMLPDEIGRLSLPELRIARNEIFARRGIYFKSSDLQSYFGQFSWYHPSTWTPALNTIEEQNVAQLQRQEALLGNAGAGGRPAPASGAPAGRSPDFIFADSDRRLLTAGELAVLSAAELRIARNEILARRGIYFKSPDLREHFEKFSWYHPFTWDPPLSPVESQNVALIRQAEVSR
jgi:hypothetical protein